jgi:hypothetical protein
VPKVPGGPTRQLSSDWLDELSLPSLFKVAKTTLDLLTDPRLWIHRRVERIEFHDEHSARHPISVDFSLPRNTPSVAQLHGVPVYLAPLFIVAKDHPNPRREVRAGSALAAYSNLDFVDETGRSLPLSTRRQCSAIAGAVLSVRAQHLARQAGRTLGDPLRTRIALIATQDSLHDTSNLHYVMQDTAGHHDMRANLRSDSLFSDLAYAFASHWLVVHPFVCPHPPDRTIIKLAYTEFTHREQGPRETELRKSLGWKSTIMWTQLPEIGAAGSYHLEITAPPDLEMTELGLIGERYKLGWRGLPQRAERKPGWRKAAREARKLQRTEARLNRRRRPPQDPESCYVLQLGPTKEGQIYLPDNPERRIGATWVKLRVRRQGFLNGALLASAVISLTLFVFAIFVKGILDATATGGSSGPVTALVLLPTLLAAYVARPGEHELTGRILRALRLLLVADGGLTFLAALRLLTIKSPNRHLLFVLHVELYSMAGLSVVLAAVFLASNVWPRAHGREYFWPANGPRD